MLHCHSKFECDTDPDSVYRESAWTGHREFLYDLFALKKPRRYVELGVHYGTSFLAACEAVKHLSLSTELIAVDTWIGDKHAGFYGEEVLSAFQRSRDAHYRNQNVVIQRSTFDEAVLIVADGSCDVLHIDGLHTYGAVSHDYNLWEHKVAPNGIILLHDVSEMNGDFGVHELWHELSGRFPSITFEHCHGLGVLFPKGKGIFHLLEDHVDLLKAHYMSSYNNHIEQVAAEHFRKSVCANEAYEAIAAANSRLEQELDAALREKALLEMRLSEIRESTSWRVTAPLRLLRDAWRKPHRTPKQEQEGAT